MGDKLVILHVDGLSANSLEQAVKDGRMPFVRHLMEEEGYELLPYRCGVPSTTPFAQAGILYGDNTNIPSFRWWDRERKVLVQFGAGSTFEKVADKYFAGCAPLTKDGACIAACYPAGAAQTFGIAYQDRSYLPQDRRATSAWHVLGPYVANPVHVGDWLWLTLLVSGRAIKDVVEARVQGRHPSRAYVITDVVEEIFVHNLTRYAVQRAMREGLSPIYAGFYSFDEAAHAFGPTDPAAARILSSVDRSVKKVAAKQAGRYELVIVSDHGQVDTVPFSGRAGRAFGAMIAEAAPAWRVQEMKGKAFGPDAAKAKGTLIVTMSGGLAHLYVADQPGRLGHSEVAALLPGLVAQLSSLHEVSLVMTRDGDADVFTLRGRELRGPDVRPLLAPYDDPEILLAQLARLNSFDASGDVVVFGAFVDGRQVNFEDQAGGHGSIGGEQLHPFLLARRDWGLRTDAVQGAHELHPILCGLRDRLLEGGLRAGSPQVRGLDDDHRAQDEQASDRLNS